VSGAAPAPWSIVHFVGRVDSSSTGEPILKSQFFERLGSYTAGALRDSFVSCGTRLFILQCLDLDITRANQLGEWIVGSGGPAVLVVAIEDHDTTQIYFQKLLADLVHNLPLPVAAQIPGSLLHSHIQVDLYFGHEAENSLQLDRWIAQLKETIAQEYEDTLSILNVMNRWKERQVKYLHEEQIARRENQHKVKVQKYEGVLKELNDLQIRLTSLPPQPWHQEAEGGIPVAEATSAHDSLDLGFEDLRDTCQPAGLTKEDEIETGVAAETAARSGTGTAMMAPPEVRGFRIGWAPQLPQLTVF
jgi:hypothetical protein